MPRREFAVLSLVFKREEQIWTGECVELGTATFGRTLDQTRAELIELVDLHLQAIEDVGERQQILQERSIAVYPETSLPSQVSRSLPVDGELFVQVHPVVLPQSAPVR